jgi:hypothetical protein
MIRAVRLTGVPKVVVVAPLDHTHVQPAADADGDAVGDRGIDERLLERHRRLHRVERVVERREEAVAGRLDDDSAVAFDRHPGARIVLGQGARHALPFLFPQTSAALDVREQNRGYAGRHIQSGALAAGLPTFHSTTPRRQCQIRPGAHRHRR